MPEYLPDQNWKSYPPPDWARHGGDRVRWVGVMGNQEPARNYGADGVINVQLGERYPKQLSSGQYELREVSPLSSLSSSLFLVIASISSQVSCRQCHSYLGWRYDVVEKVNQDRQGTYMLLDRTLLGPFSD